MCRTLHISKLHLINSIVRIDLHRKCHFQKTVLFAPVNFCSKLQPGTVRFQHNILSVDRGTNGSLHSQNCFYALFPENFTAIYMGSPFNLLVYVIGVNIPCIISSGNILVQQEMVHFISSKFLAAYSFQPEGNHLSMMIYHCPQLGVFKRIPFRNLFYTGHRPFIMDS